MDDIGPAFTERISPARKQRQLELACQISYRKPRGFVQSCLDIKSSDHDSPKVKACPKERGVSMHLAITAKSDKIIDKQLTKKTSVPENWRCEYNQKTLKSLNAKAIVHDGDMDLTGCAPLVQRCLWHLLHQLKHFFWLDGLPLKDREPYVRELIDILYHTNTVESMKKKYHWFLETLKKTWFM